MQSLGNKKMWIVFNTQHSNFNDCPPKCMYSILYIVYLRWAVTIPCMFIAWNPFLHTKKPAHHLQTFRWWESVFCQWHELRLGSLPPLRNPLWSEEFPLAPSKGDLSRLPFRASTTHSVERGLGNPMDVSSLRLEVSFGKNFQSCKHL